MSSITELVDDDLDKVSGGGAVSQSNTATLTIGDVSDGEVSIIVDQKTVHHGSKHR